MSAIIKYVGKANRSGLESELKERGYQVDLTTKKHVAVSSIAAIKSRGAKVLQDVMEELRDLRYGILLENFVYSIPGQSAAKLMKVSETPPILRK